MISSQAFSTEDSILATLSFKSFCSSSQNDSMSDLNPQKSLSKLCFIILSCTKRSFIVTSPSKPISPSSAIFLTSGNLSATLTGLLSSDEELLSKSLAHFIQEINKVAENSFSLSSLNQEFGPEARGPENSVELTQSSERHDRHSHYTEHGSECGSENHACQ